jgi:hypothetical protein
MPADDSVNSAAKVAEGSCLISSTVPRSLSLGYDPLMLGQADAIVITHLKRFNLAFVATSKRSGVPSARRSERILKAPEISL